MTTHSSYPSLTTIVGWLISSILIGCILGHSTDSMQRSSPCCAAALKARPVPVHPDECRVLIRQAESWHRGCTGNVHVILMLMASPHRSDVLFQACFLVHARTYERAGGTAFWSLEGIRWLPHVSVLSRPFTFSLSFPPFLRLVFSAAYVKEWEIS